MLWHRSCSTAWCRGDNVIWRERMYEVADHAWTSFDNVIAWRRWTHGYQWRWWALTWQHVECGYWFRWCGLMLAPLGFILIFLLFDIALLYVLGRAFVMLCGECRVMISGLLELESLNFCRNAHPSFFPFHFRFGSCWWVFVKDVLGS